MELESPASKAVGETVPEAVLVKTAPEAVGKTIPEAVLVETVPEAVRGFATRPDGVPLLFDVRERLCPGKVERDAWSKVAAGHRLHLIFVEVPGGHVPLWEAVYRVTRVAGAKYLEVQMVSYGENRKRLSVFVDTNHGEVGRAHRVNWCYDDERATGCVEVREGGLFRHLKHHFR